MVPQACRPQNRSFQDQVIIPDQDVSNSWNLPEILLMEDGTGVFKEISRILEEQGFLALLAPDAPTALEEMETTR
jgi:PleD family two-component response regulator